MSLLGIDIGSGSCKGAAFGSDGRLLAKAEAGYAAQNELDPESFRNAAAAVIRAVAAETAHDPVTALGIGSHGETFVAVDGAGRAVAPAVMNSDNRATAEAGWWERNFGAERLYAVTGLPLHAMFSLNKILWLRTHRPDVFAKSRKFLSAADYVLSRFGMPQVTDFSLAGRSMAFDIRKREWSDEILAAAGIGRDRFPEAVPAGTRIGTLPPDTAAELGLNPGVAVTVAGHDQPCGALGAGAVRPGIAAVSAGTYECAAALSAEPANNATAFGFRLNSYCHVVPDSYVTLAFFPAGIAARWFAEQFCGGDRAEAERLGRPFLEYLDERTVAACPGPSGICFTPHLVGSCNPDWDVRATGAIVGLTPEKTRHHLRKALYEGIACELARNLAALETVTGPVEELRIGGGNAKADFSVQLRADFAGKPFLVPRVTETVCLGAALLAGVASGVYPDCGAAVGQAVRIGRRFLPDGAGRRAHAAQLERYRQFYHSLAPVREFAK